MCVNEIIIFDRQTQYQFNVLKVQTKFRNKKGDTVVSPLKFYYLSSIVYVNSYSACKALTFSSLSSIKVFV